MQNQSKLSGNRPWLTEEDDKLRQQMNRTVKPNWETVARESGLNRCTSSCRYRWVDHLEPRTRPDRKLTLEEMLLIVEFRLEYGKNCWSKIAKHLLRGRRIIDVKNYWHGLANMAKRKGRDVEQHVFEKRVELMETIRAAGKFTMDYSSSIGAVAYNKLKELFPDLAVAGGSSITTGAVSWPSGDLGLELFPDLAVAGGSSITTDHDLATSSAVTDTGESGRVGNSDISDVGPTAEVDLEQFLEALTEINNPEQQLNSGTFVGGPTGFNQVPAAFNTTPNQGWSQTQDSAPPWNFTLGDAPQFHVPWEPNQQLVFHSEDSYDAGVPPNSTRRRPQHSTSSSTSIKTVNGGCSYAEGELSQAICTSTPNKSSNA